MIITNAESERSNSRGLINKSKEEQEEDTKNDNDNNNNSNNKKGRESNSDWNSSHAQGSLRESPVAVALVNLDLLQGCGLRNFVPQLALQV